MTEPTTTHPTAAQPETGPQLTGADLARVTLRAAREAARNNAAAQPRKRTGTGPRARRPRPDAREPLGLGAALRGLMEDRAWEMRAAGGNILAEWKNIAPELAPHVAAVAHDPATGRLDLRPASATWATQVRLTSQSLLARIARHAGPDVVRTLRILTPRPTTPAGDEAPSTSSTETAPAEAARPPSPGYQQAKSAHQASRPQRGPSLHVQAAIVRQDQALRARREPETSFTEAMTALAELRERAAREEETRSPHTRALHRARAAAHHQA